MRSNSGLWIVLATFATLSAGCKKATTQPSDVISIVQSGSTPTGVAGTDVPVSFLVQRTPSGGSAAPASGEQVTLSVTSGGGTINGSASASLTSGSNGLVAATWRLGTTVGAQVLHAAVAGGGTADVSISASQPPATALAFSTAPGASPVSGVVINPQPVVQLKDANGNNVPKAGVVVTAVIETGGGTLNGTTTATTNASGAAAFTNLSILGATGNRTLKFTATADGSALTLSSGAILLGPAVLTLAPAPTAGPFSGIPFFIQPVIQVKDGSGNNIAQAGIPVTVALTTGPGTLGVPSFAAAAAQASVNVATLTVNTDATGKASFSDLTLTGLGTYTLTFSSPGYTSITTASLVVTAPPVTTLANAVDAVLPGLAAGATTLASFNAPAGALSLRVGIYGGTGTNELYLRRGAYPTSTTFDCVAHVSGPSQLCNAAANFSGQWFAVIFSPTGSAASAITAYAFGPECAQTPIVLGTPVTGALNLATDCLLPISGNPPRDRYLLTLATQQTVTFNMTSSNFVGLSIDDVKSGLVGVSFAAAGGVSVPHVLPAGSYGIDVSNNLSSGGGAQTYTLTVTAASPNLAGCGIVDIFWQQTVVPLVLANTDCAGTTAGTFSDRFTTGLAFGQVLTISMSSTVFDPVLKVLNNENVTGTVATVLASNDNGGGGTTARIVFGTPGSAAPPRITVEATSAVAGATGAYTLSMDFTPSIYDVPAMLRQALTPAKVPAARGNPAGPKH